VENITLAVIVTDAVLTKHQANGPAQMSLPVSPPARRVLAAMFVFSVAALVRLATHDGISRTIHYWKRAKPAGGWVLSETTSPVDYSPLSEVQVDYQILLKVVSRQRSRVATITFRNSTLEERIAAVEQVHAGFRLPLSASIPTNGKRIADLFRSTVKSLIGQDMAQPPPKH
jgi:hypothetical protein